MQRKSHELWSSKFDLWVSQIKFTRRMRVRKFLLVIYSNKPSKQKFTRWIKIQHLKLLELTDLNLVDQVKLTVLAYSEGSRSKEVNHFGDRWKFTNGVVFMPQHNRKGLDFVDNKLWTVKVFAMIIMIVNPKNCCRIIWISLFTFVSKVQNSFNYFNNAKWKINSKDFWRTMYCGSQSSICGFTCFKLQYCSRQMTNSKL